MEKIWQQKLLQFKSCILFRLEKLHRSDIRKTGVSRHHGNTDEAHLKSLNHPRSMILRCLKGPLNLLLWCWETLVSRTAVRLIVIIIPAWSRTIHAHREIFSKSYYFNPKSDCIYRLLIHLQPTRRLFGSKSFRKC